MKIYCEKCNKDISIDVSKRFEENKVGNITCPHCNTKQKRYLSETDLLIYLAFQEIVYFILTFSTSIIISIYSFNWFSIIIFIILFIISSIITNLFKKSLYSKGYIKKETMFKSQNEDEKKISRSIRWQFFMFFALVITFFTETTAYWFFVAASLFAIFITIIKAILSANKEKGSIN